MHDIINQNTESELLLKGREKNFKFSQELQKDKSFHTLSPTIHIYLQVWAMHFEHECIRKSSKNLIDIYLKD